MRVSPLVLAASTLLGLATAARDFDYDLLVIGGGSGGLATAKEVRADGENAAR